MKINTINITGKKQDSKELFQFSDILKTYKLPLIAIALGVVLAVFVFLLLVGDNFKSLKNNFIFTSTLEAGIIKSRFQDDIVKATEKTIATQLFLANLKDPAQPLDEAVRLEDIDSVYLLTLDKKRNIEKIAYKNSDNDEIAKLTEGALTNDYMQAKLRDLAFVPGKTSQTMLNTSVQVGGHEQNYLIAFFGFVLKGKTYALLYFLNPQEVIQNAIYHDTKKNSSRRSIYLIKKYQDQSFGVLAEYYHPTNSPEADPAKSFSMQKQIGNANFQSSIELELLGEQFEIAHIPTSQYLSSAADFGVWIVFFSVLVVTMLGGYFIFYLVTFNVRTTKLVDARTKELQLAKHELEIKNEELKEINTELEDFTYIVSHDIRSPLVNILGFSEEIKLSAAKLKEKTQKESGVPSAYKKYIGDFTEQDIGESLQFIDKAVRSLDTLTSTILSYLRTDRKLTKIEEVNTKKVVENVLDRYSHQIKTQGINVKIGSLPDVRADMVSLQEVFSNIIDNAIKYSRKDIKCVIQIRGKYVPAKKHTLFSVSDNGTGIPKEMQSKVFQIMRRATLDKSIPGHGMGMPFVRSILKKHKGKIWFKSVAGEGTVFYFYIPDTETA